jgi:hypothetical protein
MDESTYDYRELVQTYIQTERKDHPHAAFEQYYARLLTLLERVFEVDFSSPPSSQGALWMLFQATVRSYVSLRTPWSNFLEAGLIVQKIEQLGPQGEKIFQLSKHIEELTQSSRDAHLQLIHDLFTCVYGKRDLVVTSQDLKARGFDDSKEPQISDYWDEI